MILSVCETLKIPYVRPPVNGAGTGGWVNGVFINAAIYTIFPSVNLSSV